METEYKGFKIKEIYQSSDGRGNNDYFIKPAITEGVFMPETGEVKMKTNLKKILSFIDLKISITNEEKETPWRQTEGGRKKERGNI